jgi:hypothetical protein
VRRRLSGKTLLLLLLLLLPPSIPSQVLLLLLLLHFLPLLVRRLDLPCQRTGVLSLELGPRLGRGVRRDGRQLGTHLLILLTGVCALPLARVAAWAGPDLAQQAAAR